MEAKRALAGLWSVPGLGPKTIATLRDRFRLAEIADCLIGDWMQEAEVELPTYAAVRIPQGRTLGELGDELLERAKSAQMKIAWLGEREYPERLAEISAAPPLLFYWGPGNAAPRRKRVAMVGTRHPLSISLDLVKRIVFDVAAAGIGVVSGAAQGIDAIAHRCAVAPDPPGETWAFVGSALDQLDPLQATLWEDLRERGATIWSELPPGVRADRSTFPRRNRLIAGCSDAVVVLRAGTPSGSRFTVNYGAEQGRVIMAVPGHPDFHDTSYCNEVIARGGYVCRDAADVMRAIGVTGYESHKPRPVAAGRVEVGSLSPDAQAAYRAIDRPGKCFDDLLVETDMRSGQLISALFELTMHGLVLEHSGRRYEKP